MEKFCSSVAFCGQKSRIVAENGKNRGSARATISFWPCGGHKSGHVDNKKEQQVRIELFALCLRSILLKKTAGFSRVKSSKNSFIRACQKKFNAIVHLSRIYLYRGNAAPFQFSKLTLLRLKDGFICERSLTSINTKYVTILNFNRRHISAQVRSWAISKANSSKYKYLVLIHDGMCSSYHFLINWLHVLNFYRIPCYCLLFLQQYFEAEFKADNWSVFRTSDWEFRFKNLLF